MRTPKFTAEQIAEQTARCIEMHERGLSNVNVGIAVGISEFTVQNRLREYKAAKADKAAAAPPPVKWTDGSRRYARMLHRKRYALAFIAEELNQEFPGSHVTGSDVRAELYQGRL